MSDCMSRTSVALLCEVARSAGSSSVSVYAPGLVELAQFYLDNHPTTNPIDADPLGIWPVNLTQEHA
jgi:hypothetical protein